MIAKKKKLNLLSSIGESLKEARKKRGISVEEAAKEINIQKKYLDSLENGEYNNLPADVYADNFLKKYAEFLEIFNADFFNFYKKEKEVFNNINDKSKHYDVKKKFLRSPFAHNIYITPKIINFSILIVVVLFIVFYFWHQIGFLIAAPELIIESPSKDIEVSSSFITVSGKTDYDSFIRINNQSIILNIDGSFSQKIDLSPGLNILEIKSMNKLGKESRVIRNVLYNVKTNQDTQSPDK